jgi:aryl carrier-like protein
VARQRGLDLAELDAAFVAPATETEQTVAAIWQDVLGLPRVGRRDNFFDLGGHSLLLARVHAELRRQLGTDLTLIDLFKHPTVSALADALASSASAPDSGPLPGIHDRAASRREMLGRQRQLRQRLRS